VVVAGLVYLLPSVLFLVLMVDGWIWVKFGPREIMGLDFYVIEQRSFSLEPQWPFYVSLGLAVVFLVVGRWLPGRPRSDESETADGVV
jgi:hypothetical protein